MRLCAMNAETNNFVVSLNERTMKREREGERERRREGEEKKRKG